MAPRMAHGGRKPLCAGGGRASVQRPYSDGTWHYLLVTVQRAVLTHPLEHGAGIAGRQALGERIHRLM